MSIIKTRPLYLEKYIQCFYSVLAEEGSNTIHRRLPDGTLDLVFNLGEAVSLYRDEVQFHRMPVVSLTGLYPDRSFLCYANKVHLAGVVFQPGTAHLFIKDSLEHLKASTIDAGDIFGKDIYCLLEQLAGFRSEVSKHYFLEKLLMQYIGQYQKRTLTIYNDQAHFNKDFRKIVGSSPGLYFNDMHPLAENFLHLI